MAELQKKAEVAKSPSTPSERPVSEAKPTADSKAVTEAKPAEAKPQEVTPAAKPVAPAAETKPAAEEKPKAAPKKAPPPSPPASPEPSFVDDLMENPLYAIAGAGILALLGFLGYGAYKRRKAVVPMTATGATSSLASDLKSGTMPSAKSSGVVDTGNSSFLTDFEKTGPGIIDIEEVDPVAEAEVYIAYGRDAQAEEILKEAMAKDGSRHEIPLKLLEIYSARKSAASFEAVAKDLHRSVGATHPVWARVADMGRKLDPANALYMAAGVAAADQLAAEPPHVEAPSVPHEGGPTTEELVSHGEGLDFDVNLPPSPVGAETPFAASEPLLDLSLESKAETEMATASAESNTLDFDLGGIGISKPIGHRPEPPASEQTLLARPKFASQFTDDDLDLSEFSAGAPPTTPAAASAHDSALIRPAMDAALPKLALNGEETLIPATVDSASMRAAPTLDLGGLNLDLSPTSSALQPSAADDDDSEWHSVATKLDLARAYLEIGDKDGAREILQEVMQEGDAEQKREAETLTAGIS